MGKVKNGSEVYPSAHFLLKEKENVGVQLIHN